MTQRSLQKEIDFFSKNIGGTVLVPQRLAKVARAWDKVLTKKVVRFLPFAVSVVLGMEVRTSCMPGKSTVTDLHSVVQIAQDWQEPHLFRPVDRCLLKAFSSMRSWLSLSAGKSRPFGGQRVHTELASSLSCSSCKIITECQLTWAGMPLPVGLVSTPLEAASCQRPLGHICLLSDWH